MRCTATKSTLYEQEPVVLTYKVYARSGVGLSQVVPRRKPEMKGFWTQEVELPSNLQPTYENIGGSTYRVFTFMQFVAFPSRRARSPCPRSSRIAAWCSATRTSTRWKPSSMEAEA